MMGVTTTYIRQRYLSASSLKFVDYNISVNLIDYSYSGEKMRETLEDSSQLYSIEMGERKTNEILESSYRLYQIKMIEGLKRFYIFKEEEKIQAFLLSNEDLVLILYEAIGHIYSTFGPSVINFLELHSDTEESWEELFIVIKSPYPPEKARELMDKLGDEWFLDVINKVENRLCITEEPL